MLIFLFDFAETIWIQLRSYKLIYLENNILGYCLQFLIFIFLLLFVVLILIRISVTILILFFLDYLGKLFTVFFPEYNPQYLGASLGVFQIFIH